MKTIKIYLIKLVWIQFSLGSIIEAMVNLEIWNLDTKIRFLIHSTHFTNLLSFWNTLGNAINTMLLEGHGWLEHQRNFFYIKKEKSKVEKNEDENLQLSM